MPATSTIPSVKAHLLAHLTAQLPGVTVTWGGPTAEEDLTDEMVYFGDVDQDEEDRGFGTTTEEYTLEIVARVRGYGQGTEQATEERLWQIRQQIADAVNQDTSLAGLLSAEGARLERTRQDNLPTENGWYSRARMDLRCIARLLHS